MLAGTSQGILTLVIPLSTDMGRQFSWNTVSTVMIKRDGCGCLPSIENFGTLKLLRCKVLTEGIGI